MKLRYLLIILLLLLPGCTESEAHLSALMLGGPGASPVPPPPGPDYAFHIEFDSDIDWSDGYTIGGDDYSAGDQVGAKSTTAPTRSTAQYVSTPACMLEEVSSYLQWDITASDVFRSSQGYIEFSIWPIASTGTNGFFESRTGSLDYFYLSYTSALTLAVTFRHDNIVTLWDEGVLTEGQWNQVQVRWAAGEDIDVRICADGTCDAESWVQDNDADVCAAMDVEPSNFILGKSSQTFTDSLYLDDFTIWLNKDQS